VFGRTGDDVADPVDAVTLGVQFPQSTCNGLQPVEQDGERRAELDIVLDVCGVFEQPHGRLEGLGAAPPDRVALLVDGRRLETKHGRDAVRAPSRWGDDPEGGERPHSCSVAG